MEYWNVDESTMDEKVENLSGGGFSMKGPDGKTFVGSFEDERNKGIADDYDILANDPIFKGLYPREKYSDKS